MSKIDITIPFDEEKLSALNFSLEKEHTSVQQRLEQTLRELYDKTVPAPLREYLERKAVPPVKPKRPVRPSPMKPTVPVKPADAHSPAMIEKQAEQK